MAGQLMLVNPKRRRRRATTKRNPVKRRRKMSAKQAAIFGPRRKRRATKSASPRRRRRRARVASTVKRAVRRVRRTGRRFARSRSGSLSLGSIKSGGILKSTVLPAAIGAIGAVALDAAYAYLPLPANLKGGQFAAPVKAAAILGIGALAGKFLPRQRSMIEGAVFASLTIMAYNFARAQVTAMFPNIQLSEYVDGIGYTGAAQFLPDYSAQPALSEYVSGSPGAHDSSWSNSYYGDEVM